MYVPSLLHGPGRTIYGIAKVGIAGAYVLSKASSQKRDQLDPDGWEPAPSAPELLRALSVQPRILFFKAR